MAFSLVASTTGSSGSVNDYTTSGIDTTGANLIVVSIAWHPGSYGSGVLSDSKGNTWTGLTERAAFFVARNKLFYCLNPTVGSGHTFSTGQFNGQNPAIGVLAFSGAHASSSYANENGATVAPGTSLATGSITPPENDCLVVSGLGTEKANTTTNTAIGSSFTAFKTEASGGNSCGSGIAYLIQTTASAVNPTWTWTTSTYACASIASFKAAAGGGGGGSSGAAMHYYRQCQRHEQPRLILPDRELITELPPRFNRIENRLAT